ncbi:MAG: isoaspartyl peptidase/L-asparaginase [Cyanobacteriota bacterium]|nr:isoaspartyl peptidase/L-asparaginase [Cyanobacteriota bacterium]
MVQPKLIIHGGAGGALDGGASVESVRAVLEAVVTSAYTLLSQGASAEAAVMQACQALEADPLFNAGTGSVMQSDGQIRMSAALMLGSPQSFSSVINTSRVEHPILMAQFLQTSPDRVVAELGAAELAREMQLPIYDPTTPKRLQEWVHLQGKAHSQRVLTSLAMGTIGAVALDERGEIAVGTSTGGRGFERIGRVSDSATPAGTYSNAYAGVSCTGVGEDILDEGLAVRIVVRVTDGMSLAEAVAKTFAEARSRQRAFGIIALAQNGDIAWDTTTDVLLAAYHDGQTTGLTI